MLDERAERRQRRRRPGRIHGDDRGGVNWIREKRRERRLRACAFCRRSAAIGVDVEDFTLRTKVIEPGRVTGSLALGQHVAQLTQAVARRDELALAALCRCELRVRDSEIRPRAPHRLVDAARAGLNQRRCCLHFQSTPSCNRESLTDHRHVFGDAGDGLSIERDARVRPATGRQDIGAGHVDGRTNRADARTRRREAGQRFRFGQRQRLSAGVGRQHQSRQRGAEHHTAHNTSNGTENETDDGTARQFRSGGCERRGAKGQAPSRRSVRRRGVV
ncbi:MAG: hypothetical protein AUH72_17615 [Acidobacteria bacterium 13_1_40CM_4_65_8]|nr:MAG: hypothetical protein AUH72_17615 [Acidobacteria bacterium 13_1_40CM_4_65_8]